MPNDKFGVILNSGSLLNYIDIEEDHIWSDSYFIGIPIYGTRFHSQITIRYLWNHDETRRQDCKGTVYYLLLFIIFLSFVNTGIC